MAITPEHVGRSYPPLEPCRASRVRIREFAAVSGGREGGDPEAACASADPVAPPTFAMVIAASARHALFVDEELGVALHRTMHNTDRATIALEAVCGGQKIPGAARMEVRL